MFSRRTPASYALNPLQQTARMLRAQGKKVLHLAESNLTEVGLFDDLPKDVFVGPLADDRAFFYRPDPQGMVEARRAIATYYRSVGVDAHPDQLVLCASTSEAYGWLFQLLADANDEILFPSPSYPLFEHIANLSLIAMRSYPLFYDDRWWLEQSSLEESIHPNTRAVVVVHPNNPTGSYLQRQEAKQVFSSCRRHGLALISDEVFQDYAFEIEHERASSMISEAREEGVLTFVLSGFSKVLALPQHKLAWIYVAGPEPLRAQAQERLEFIADTFLSVGSAIQYAAPTFLEHRRLIQERIRKRLYNNLSIVKERLRGSACQLLHPEGGFSAIIRLPRICTEEEWVMRFLQEDQLLVHPGYFYEMEEDGHIVVSLICLEKIMREGINRIVFRVNQVSGTSGIF